jgi:hypothetical protein
MNTAWRDEAHFNEAALTRIGRRIGWLAAVVVVIGLLSQ